MAAGAAAGAAAIASRAAGAPWVRTANKSGIGPVVVGEGDHRYECLHDWGTLPADIAWGNTHGVAQDTQGNIYIKHTVHASSAKGDAVVVFDADGRFVRSWGAEYRGGAHGLHLSRERDGEYLYLCDQARGIVDKTTLTGEKVWTLRWPEESGVYNNAGEYHPTNVAVVPTGPRAGEFFVADGYGKSWIHRYSPRGEYLGTFGGPGKERGQMSCPHGLMIDTRLAEPRLVVADRSNKRLQYFTLDGRHTGFVSGPLKAPCHFDQRGGELLVPDLSARVTILAKDDSVIVHLGDDNDFRLRDKAREQFIPGKFIAPHSAIFDRDGNIFVVEWVEIGRVTKLRRV
jgi:hypothetical protein